MKISTHSKSIRFARACSPLILVVALAACNGSTDIDPNSIEQTSSSASIENGKLAVSPTHPDFKAEISDDGIVSLAWPAAEEANSYSIYRNEQLIDSSNEPFYVDSSARGLIASRTKRAGNASSSEAPVLRYSIESVEDSGARPIADNLTIDLELNPVLLAALQTSQAVSSETASNLTEEAVPATETPTDGSTTELPDEATVETETPTETAVVAEANPQIDVEQPTDTILLTTPTDLQPAAGAKVSTNDRITYQWSVPALELGSISSFDFYIYDRASESVAFRNMELPTSVCSAAGRCSYSPAALSLPAATNHVWRVAGHTDTQYSEFSYVVFEVIDDTSVTATASTENSPVIGAAEAEPNTTNQQTTTPVTEETPAATTAATPIQAEPTPIVVVGQEVEIEAETVVTEAAPEIAEATPATTGSISVPGMPTAVYPPAGTVFAENEVVVYQWTADPETMSETNGFDFYLFDRVSDSVIYRDSTLTTSLCDSAGNCSHQPTVTLPVGADHVWRVAAINAAGYSEFTYTTVSVDGPAVEVATVTPSTAPTIEVVTPTAETVTPTQTSSSEVNPNAIFVSTTGNNSNDGLTEATAVSSIQVGINAANPGDTVYVKAGNYGAVNLNISKSGTTGNPITIEGYQSSPGDNPSIVNFNHNSSLDASVMPLLDGGSRGSDEVGISIVGHYVYLKNFQLTRYKSGLYASNADYGLIENVISVDMGDPNENYEGMGIFIAGGTDHSIIRNCVVVDAGAQGLTLVGTNNLMEGNSVYATDNSTGHHSAMDYYFVVSDSTNNVIRNNYIERVGDLDHVGHGFTVKGDSQDNVFESNTAVNMKGGGLVVRWSQTYNNTFRDNTVIGGDGILARDGANNNLFEDNTVTGSRYGIYSLNSYEDPLNTANIATQNNTFRNITIRDVTHSVFFFSAYASREATTSGNIYENINVDGAPLLINAYHRTSNNIVINSTFTNVDHYAYSGAPRTNEEIDITFENSSVSNSGFVLP